MSEQQPDAIDRFSAAFFRYRRRAWRRWLPPALLLILAAGLLRPAVWVWAILHVRFAAFTLLALIVPQPAHGAESRAMCEARADLILNRDWILCGPNYSGPPCDEANAYGPNRAKLRQWDRMNARCDSERPQAGPGYRLFWRVR